jgi:hypothetical protein
MMSDTKKITDVSKSVKVTAVMSEDLKDTLKAYADSRRWTMSQAVVYLVEQGLDKWTANESAPQKPQ